MHKVTIQLSKLLIFICLLLRTRPYALIDAGLPQVRNVCVSEITCCERGQVSNYCPNGLTMAGTSCVTVSQLVKRVAWVGKLYVCYEHNIN